MPEDNITQKDGKNKQFDFSPFLFWFAWLVLTVTGIAAAYVCIYNLDNHLTLLEQHGISVIYSIINIVVSFEALIGMAFVYLLRNKKIGCNVAAFFCGLTALIMLACNILHIMLQGKELSGTISVLLYNISGQYVGSVWFIIANAIAMIALLLNKKRNKGE